MEILRRLLPPVPGVGTRLGRDAGPDRLTVHPRASHALEAWAARYGDAFIPVRAQPGRREVGVVRGLRSGVPFELRGWLDAPPQGGGEGVELAPPAFTIEIRAVVPCDVDGLDAPDGEALLAAARGGAAVRLEHGYLVLTTRDPVLRPPGLDPDVLDRLVAAAVDAVRTLTV